MKKQSYSKIKEEFNAKIKRIQESWQESTQNHTADKLFRDWMIYGSEVLKKTKQAIPTDNIIEYISAYQSFPWEKGE